MSWQVQFITSGGEVVVKNSDVVEMCDVTIAKFTNSMTVLMDYTELGEFHAALGEILKMQKTMRKVKKRDRDAGSETGTDSDLPTGSDGSVLPQVS